LLDAILEKGSRELSSLSLSLSLSKTEIIKGQLTTGQEHLL
jgi:hypothetical protein